MEIFEELLSGSLYYNKVSFEVAIFSLMLAFVLSTTIAFTFRLTFRGSVFPNHFFQAMVLSSLVTAMIMMSVGSNFAIGFGIIGAVAIIRFRTLIRDPRNIIFMFASISIGIASGVHGYSVAVAGTILFCMVSFLLYLSPFGSTHTRFRLQFVCEQVPDALTKIFQEYCKVHNQKEIRKQTKGTLQIEYLVELERDKDKNDFFYRLLDLPEISNVRLEQIGNVDNEL